MISVYGLLWAAGGNDILATKFHLDLNTITYFMRGAIFVIPPLVFIFAKRWCISLQRHDNDMLLHGYESGIIMRDAQGGYSEKHLPLSEGHAYTLTARARDEVYTGVSGTDANGVSARTPGWTSCAPGCRRPGSRPTCRSRPWPSSRRRNHHAELEHAHDAPLEVTLPTVTSSNGRHDVSEDEPDAQALGTTFERPGRRPGLSSFPGPECNPEGVPGVSPATEHHQPREGPHGRDRVRRVLQLILRPDHRPSSTP